MKLENPTPLAASIARASILYRDLVFTTVVVKAAFEVGARGVVHLLEEQLPVQEADIATPFGSIDGEMAPVKDGCDLAVMGHAYAPGSKPTQRMEVSVEAGEWSRRVVVFGARTWQSDGQTLRPSAPEPFLEMPLSYENAFGGLTSTGEFETAHAWNPDGKGYVHREQDVPGTPLPNLEEPDQLIQQWNDQPVPAGLGPLPRQAALRLERGADVDLEAGVTQLRPAMFNWAHPRMLLPRYPDHTTLRVTGMRPEGEWSAELPWWRASVSVELGERTEVLPLTPDTICAFPSYNRLFIVARCAFIYQYIPERKRTTTVHWLDNTTLSSPSSIEERLAAGDTTVELQPLFQESPIPFELLRELHPLRTIMERVPVVVSS